jgi:hypothetical protein
LTAGARARDEIRKAAESTAAIERRLAEVEAEMASFGVSPNLDHHEAIAEAARRLSVLAESLPHGR